MQEQHVKNIIKNCAYAVARVCELELSDILSVVLLLVKRARNQQKELLSISAIAEIGLETIKALIVSWSPEAWIKHWLDIAWTCCIAYAGTGERLLTKYKIIELFTHRRPTSTR